MENMILKDKKILIVEDDLSSRLYLNKILEKTGAELINAADGKEALDITGSDKKISIVLMDIQLPVIDGYTAAKKMREMRKDLIIIAQTAYSIAGDMENIISSGFDDYLTKPIYSDVLIAKLVYWLDR
jgi:CheY-like chemotaxis protein